MKKSTSQEKRISLLFFQINMIKIRQKCDSFN
jgi:hypothetical protein